MPCGSDEWFKSAFSELYPVIYAHRSIAAAEPEVRFAVSVLGITREQSVLDLCCGDGRHLSHLRHYTNHLIGLDYSAAMLRFARRHAEPARLVRADMRDIPFRGMFDVALNFFTSFGYFESREDNLRVVRGVANALAPHGQFLIDYVNPVFVERTLTPESRRRVDEYEIHERRWISRDPWRVHKGVLVMKDGKTVDESIESVQLYTPDEFVRFLHDGGLRVERLLGEFSEAPIDDSRPRMIAIGQRM